MNNCKEHLKRELEEYKTKPKKQVYPYWSKQLKDRDWHKVSLSLDENLYDRVEHSVKRSERSYEGFCLEAVEGDTISPLKFE